MPTEVTGSTAAVTLSKVSKPTAANEIEVLASEQVSDSSAQEPAPVADLSGFQQRCAAACAKASAFQGESQLSHHTNSDQLPCQLLWSQHVHGRAAQCLMLRSPTATSTLLPFGKCNIPAASHCTCAVRTVLISCCLARTHVLAAQACCAV